MEHSRDPARIPGIIGNTIPSSPRLIINRFLNRRPSVRIGPGSQERRWLANQATKLAFARDATQGKDACWPCLGQRGRNGEIYLYSGNRSVPVDQAALEVAIGRFLLRNEVVVHDELCRFQWCGNPSHLSVGPRPRHLHSVAP